MSCNALANDSTKNLAWMWRKMPLRSFAICQTTNMQYK